MLAEPYDRSFVDMNGDVRVVLSGAAVGEMITAQMKASPNETGGVVIGAASDEQVRVMYATRPPGDSRATSTSFTRGTRGLVRMLKRKWRANQYYVGEWHAHPGAAPEPSPRDFASLEEVARDGSLMFECPILVVLGGTSDDVSFTVHVRWRDGMIERLTERAETMHCYQMS